MSAGLLQSLSHAGHDGYIGQNEYPDFLISYARHQLLDFQLRKISPEEHKQLSDKFVQDCDCKRCKHQTLTVVEKLKRFVKKAKSNHLNLAYSDVRKASQFQTVLEVKPSDSQPWVLRPRQFFFDENVATSHSLNNVILQVCGRAARRIYGFSNVGNLEVMFDHGSNLFPSLVAVCSPFEICFVLISFSRLEEEKSTELGIPPIWTRNSFRVQVSESICLASSAAFILLKLCSENCIPTLFNAAGEIHEYLTGDDFETFSVSSESLAGNQEFRNVNLISKPFSSNCIFEIESMQRGKAHFALKVAGAYSPY
jgi:hypothetical protein